MISAGKPVVISEGKAPGIYGVDSGQINACIDKAIGIKTLSQLHFYP
ncbi:hypothetical protein BGP_6661 [Beggiatoa sp. PS]|nr:hypothetical protein BGP_6661 [Beggiatoa sp. PS]